jgi:hypothetical protein
MRGIDQTCKQMATVVLLVSGALVLVPTAASAQFNIPFNFNPFLHGGGHSSHSSHHSKSSSSSSSSKDKDASSDQDSSSDQDVKSDNKGGRRQTSASSHDNSSAGDVTPPSKTPAKSSNSDDPVFAPLR